MSTNKAREAELKNSLTVSNSLTVETRTPEDFGVFETSKLIIF